MPKIILDNKYKILALLLIIIVNPVFLPFALEYLLFIEVVGFIGFSSSLLYYYRYLFLGYLDKAMSFIKRK